MAGYYDKNKDYSKELQRTDLSASERDRLTKERENKIADKYGGREPNMIGSDKTYSQTYGAVPAAALRGPSAGFLIPAMTMAAASMECPPATPK